MLKFETHWVKRSAINASTYLYFLSSDSPQRMRMVTGIEMVEKYYSDGHSGWRTGLSLWQQRAGWGSLATLDRKERWSILSETGKVSVHSAGPGEMTPKLGCLNLLGKLLVDVNQSGITRELKQKLWIPAVVPDFFTCVFGQLCFSYASDPTGQGWLFSLFQFLYTLPDGCSFLPPTHISLQ